MTADAASAFKTRPHRKTYQRNDGCKHTSRPSVPM